MLTTLTVTAQNPRSHVRGPTRHTDRSKAVSTREAMEEVRRGYARPNREILAAIKAVDVQSLTADDSACFL